MVGINVSHSLGPHSTRGRDVHCTAGAARLVAAQGQAAGDRAGRGKPWPCGEAETGPGRQSRGLGRRQQGPAARTHRPRVTGKRLSISLPIYEIHHFVARGRGTLGFVGGLDGAKGGSSKDTSPSDHREQLSIWVQINVIPLGSITWLLEGCL